MDEKRGSWCTLSFDEICHNDELRSKYKIEPAKDAVKILAGIIAKCLSALGVQDPWNPDTVRIEQNILNIAIRELDTEGAMELCRVGNYDYTPNVEGIYIYQNDKLKFFISDAAVTGLGRVVFNVRDEENNVAWEEGNIEIKVG